MNPADHTLHSHTDTHAHTQANHMHMHSLHRICLHTLFNTPTQTHTPAGKTPTHTYSTFSSYSAQTTHMLYKDHMCTRMHATHTHERRIQCHITLSFRIILILKLFPSSAAVFFFFQKNFKRLRCQLAKLSRRFLPCWELEGEEIPFSPLPKEGFLPHCRWVESEGCGVYLEGC